MEKRKNDKMRCVCNVCEHESGGMCLTKKIGVHINKHRWCDKFVFNSGKVKVRTMPPSVLRPDTMYDVYKKKKKDELKKSEDFFTLSGKESDGLVTEVVVPTYINKSPDCLARLRTEETEVPKI